MDAVDAVIPASPTFLSTLPKKMFSLGSMVTINGYEAQTSLNGRVAKVIGPCVNANGRYKRPYALDS